MPSRTSQVRFSPSRSCLQHVDDAQALLVMVEAARNERAQHPLAGVAERRVAEIVTERDRLGQLLVEVQHLGDGAGDLRHLQRVRQARAVVIAARREEHLRLVLQPAKRLGVDDAIAIALEGRTDRHLRPPGAGGPRLAPLLAACGARISRSRCSSCSRIVDSAHASRISAGSWCRAPAAARRTRRPGSGRDRRTSFASRGRRRHARAARSPAAARARASDRCSASSGRCRDRR